MDPESSRDDDGELVKLHVSAIGEVGKQSQNQAWVAVGFLSLVFFGITLPSAGLIDKVRQLQSDAEFIDVQIAAHKQEADDLAARELRRTRRSADSASGQDVNLATLINELQKEMKALREGKRDDEPRAADQVLTEAEKLLGALPGALDLLKRAVREALEDDKPARSPAQILGKEGREVEVALKALQESLDALVIPLKNEDTRRAAQEGADGGGTFIEGESAPSAFSARVRRFWSNPGRESARMRLKSLQLEQKKRVTQSRLAHVTSRTVSLKFLGTFGLGLEGLDEVRLPLLYLPPLWSFSACLVLMFVSRQRALMLALHLRVLRTAEGARRVELERSGLLCSRWWWMAPIRTDTADAAEAAALRAALGWQEFHRSAVLGVTAFLMWLLALQAGSLWVSSRLIPILSRGVERWCLVAVSVALALLLTALAIRWLFFVPVSAGSGLPVPAREPSRRTFILGGAIATCALLCASFWRAGPGAPLWHRPRRRLCRQPAFVAADESLVAALPPGRKAGFFLNPRSKVVHYVSSRRRASASRCSSDGAATSARSDRYVLWAPPAIEQEKLTPITLEEVLQSAPAPTADGSAPRLARRRAAFMVEQEALALLSARPPRASDPVDAALRMLRMALERRTPDTAVSYLRCFDLYAALAQHHDRSEALQWVIEAAGTEAEPRFQKRVQQWRSESWRRRWRASSARWSKASLQVASVAR